jgi:excinuclease UvrABC helicase subunit UvrB
MAAPKKNKKEQQDELLLQRQKIVELEDAMQKAAQELDFERAIALREELITLKKSNIQLIF